MSGPIKGRSSRDARAALLDFSIFPSLLLIATLFRLALNVSSTRLVLLHGDAGKVIESFGHFVVGGSGNVERRVMRWASTAPMRAEARDTSSSCVGCMLVN